MVRRKAGRRKGSRSKGFFFRPDRGWFSLQTGKFVPLLDEHGARIRDEDADLKVLKSAHARLLVREEERAKPMPTNKDGEVKDAEVGEVCAQYLKFVRDQLPEKFQPVGLGKTYLDRGQTLFDFCYGLPSEFFCDGDLKKREEKGSGEAKRIHEGYGQKMCSELTAADIDAWLGVHKWQPGGRRTRVQAIKRALNFGVERKAISKNPIKGYKLPKSAGRITYLTPEQEQAMIKASSPAFAKALRDCIRTGARFGCEFAALRPKHVKDYGDRMEWIFKPTETKTRKLRRILITDKGVMENVRAGLKNEFVYLNQNGEPWNRKMISQNFRRAKAKILKKGIHLDEDACMYSCRHTYAKRILEGYWGKPASITTLARLMGNSVKVCIEHYLQFSEVDNEMLWGSA